MFESQFLVHSSSSLSSRALDALSPFGHDDAPSDPAPTAAGGHSSPSNRHMRRRSTGGLPSSNGRSRSGSRTPTVSGSGRGHSLTASRVAPHSATVTATTRAQTQPHILSRPPKRVPHSSSAVGSGRLKRAHSSLTTFGLSASGAFRPAPPQPPVSMTTVTSFKEIAQPPETIGHDEFTVVKVTPGELDSHGVRARNQVARLIDWMNEHVGGLPASPVNGVTRILRPQERLYVLVASDSRRHVCAAAVVTPITHAWRMEPPISRTNTNNAAANDTTTNHTMRQTKSSCSMDQSTLPASSLSSLPSPHAAVTIRTDPHLRRVSFDGALPDHSHSSSQADEMTQPLDEYDDDDQLIPSPALHAPPLVSSLDDSPITVSDLSPRVTANRMAASPAPEPHIDADAHPHKRARFSASCTDARVRAPIDDGSDTRLPTAKGDDTESRMSAHPTRPCVDGAATSESHPRTFPARIGIDKIVVAAKYRRQGFATKIIEYIRSPDTGEAHQPS